jgi:hypothetical protein
MTVAVERWLERRNVEVVLLLTTMNGDLEEKRVTGDRMLNPLFLVHLVLLLPEFPFHYQRGVGRKRTLNSGVVRLKGFELTVFKNPLNSIVRLSSGFTGSNLISPNLSKKPNSQS